MRLGAGAVIAAVLIGIGVACLGSTRGATAGAEELEPTSDRAPASAPNPIVVLYGDSLAWESREHFAAAFAAHPEVRVITRTYGGTAICDWLDTMREDAAALQPGAVVVEFSGNALTPCMMASEGESLNEGAYLDRYRSDAETVVDIFAPTGTKVHFAGAPIPKPTGAQNGFNGGRLNTMFRDIAVSAPGAVEFVDAGAAVLEGGEWTASLPCLPTEPCDDAAANIVRAPDGNHFCPAGDDARAGVTGDCPVWSSGAYRFANAMATPVLEMF